MATDQARAIAPGSLPYGERGGVEDALMGQPPPAAPGLPPAGPPGAQPTGDEDITPESVLEQGPVSDLPVTSGLDIGPGPGPFQGIESTTEQERLRHLAMNADSALLRHMARLALRRIYLNQQRS